jgi:soluble lytic murein transglycosylase
VPSAEKRAALAHNEVVQATEMLYAVNENDLVIPIMADLAERGSDVSLLVALAELTARHDDARYALLIGKGALGPGHPFDHYAARLGRAHPVFGDPQLRPAHHRKRAGLSGAVRRRHAPADRGGPAPRSRCGQLSGPSLRRN